MLRFYDFCRQSDKIVEIYFNYYYIDYIITLDFKKIRNKNIQKIVTYLQVIIFHIYEFFIKEIF